jgi:hypothetical protein
MGTLDIGLKRRMQVIFQRDSAVKCMSIFDDAFRKFQSDFGRNPSLAFVDSRAFILLQEAWKTVPGSEGCILIYGVKVFEDAGLVSIGEVTFE